MANDSNGKAGSPSASVGLPGIGTSAIAPACNLFMINMYSTLTSSDNLAIDFAKLRAIGASMLTLALENIPIKISLGTTTFGNSISSIKTSIIPL